MNSLKKSEGFPLLNFEEVPGILLLNFEGGPGVPFLNFRGVPGPIFKLWRGPRSQGPGTTFTACLFQYRYSALIAKFFETLLWRGAIFSKLARNAL